MAILLCAGHYLDHVCLLLCNAYSKAAKTEWLFAILEKAGIDVQTRLRQPQFDLGPAHFSGSLWSL